MTSTSEQLDAILTHTAGLAEAARGHLDQPVRACPGWSVADLVSHVTGVHWFWRTIAEELLPEPPDQARRPARAPDDALVDALLTGADALVATLRAADQQAACWTWAPGHQDVAFITRHQVQEAAVHHWDAADAAGRPWSMDAAAAADAVEEFLTVSVSSEADPADPPRPALDGALVLGDLLVTDDTTPGTTTWRRVPEPPADALVVTADAPTRLLWLYGRPVSDPGLPADDDPLVRRLRALCFTD